MPPNKAEETEYNPRWKGYVYIILSSLVCFAALSNVEAKFYLKADWAVAMAFSIFTFSVSFLVILTDRFQCLPEQVNYTKAMEGKLEGGTLVFFVLFWIVNVALLTKVGGLAYYATNIYFSSWLALISCVFTLDRWGADTDVISIRELTQLSTTLKSWYCLLLASLVVFGSAIDMNIHLEGVKTGSTAYAITIGLFSALVSAFFIFVHYKFFERKAPRLKAGGWAELTTAFFMILFWIVCVALLTQDNGIAATIGGTGCRLKQEAKSMDNCTIIMERTENNETVSRIDECLAVFQQEMPGSNLYLFGWISLIASINITLRWKAAQALQFAQSAQSRVTQHAIKKKDNDDDNSDADDDDDDDDDDV